MTSAPIPGTMERFGNVAIDPTTGQPRAAVPAAFTVGGVATDPTAVELRIKKPDGSVLVYGWPAPGTTGTAIRESAGRFFADVLIDVPGMWRFELKGTGTVTAIADGSIWVQRSQVQ